MEAQMQKHQHRNYPLNTVLSGKEIVTLSITNENGITAYAFKDHVKRGCETDMDMTVITNEK